MWADGWEPEMELSGWNGRMVLYQQRATIAARMLWEIGAPDRREWDG